MTQVNAPYSLTKIRPDKELTTGMNGYLSVLERILQQLYLRGGGAAGNSVEADLAALTIVVDQLVIDVDQIEVDLAALSSALDAEIARRSFTYYDVNAAGRTTSGNEFLRVSDACIITLNATPDDLEMVKIQPTVSSQVTIIGPINGDSSLTIMNSYDMALLIYSSDTSEWSIS